ncbi:MAG: L,D-transpeptidase [Rhodoferax sp.]|nr:L,D-transpeptidase [Rhodoferax sp.]
MAASEAVAPSAKSADAQPALDLALRIVQSGDHGNVPFAIVDKQAAQITVYRNDGTLVGTSTVLLGITPGDASMPGVGYRTQTGQLRLEDRTTPAGRFDTVPGRNLTGEAVVWMDYGTALAIHRLRPAPVHEKRVQRMASGNAHDKRISAGCVVVPEAFYDGIIRPLLGNGRAVVYVMPESTPWQHMWNLLALQY